MSLLKSEVSACLLISTGFAYVRRCRVKTLISYYLPIIKRIPTTLRSFKLVLRPTFWFDFLLSSDRNYDHWALAPMIYSLIAAET